ncbi:hypothetical protein, partial [Georgenia thermotolerans]
MFEEERGGGGVPGDEAGACCEVAADRRVCEHMEAVMAQARAEAAAEEAAERAAWAAAPVLEARAAAIEGDRHARALLGWWDEDELAAALAREECPESFAPTPPTAPVVSVPGP